MKEGGKRLNRDKRRKFIKEAKKKGIPKEYIDAYLAKISGEEQDRIEENDQVMVNVERIKRNKNYNSMLDRYKEFIENCDGKVFKAHVEDGGLISLKENPEWLFWEGDLIKYEGDIDE